MNPAAVSIWRRYPFLRILIAFTTGIVLQYHGQFSLLLLLVAAGVLLLCCLIFLLMPMRLWMRPWQSLCLQLLLVMAGACTIYTRDIRHQQEWIGQYTDSVSLLAIQIDQPLSEKKASWKTNASVRFIRRNNTWEPAIGTLFVYFRKDSTITLPSFGTLVLLRKQPERIRNSGNPGAFDFEQYAAFQDCYHQVFLKKGDYLITDTVTIPRFRTWLYQLQQKILSVFRQYLPDRKNYAVAEALLIGYRDDLDPDLLQSYSNTGVVHIIAISGLHLGMLYGLLLALLKPFRKKKMMRWLQPLLLITALWFFTLLAGAAASILRSAVMFSFIIMADLFNRRSQIWNTLAASATCMLCWNPFLLWDAGFQLSYGAVAGIVLLMQPIYRLVYVQNHLLRHIWQMTAITLSAQVFTLPLVLWYFHQFPNLFLFTNAIAVPLSGLILYLELVLLVVSPFSGLNTVTGNTINWLIGQMNGLMERTSRLPFAVTDQIPFTRLQMLLLMVAITSLLYVVFRKRKPGIWLMVCSIGVMMGIHSLRKMAAKRQTRLLVYNLPRQSAIDLYSGVQYDYLGDKIAVNPSNDRMFFQPARLQYGVKKTKNKEHTTIHSLFISGPDSNILIIDGAYPPPHIPGGMKVHIVLMGHNPTIGIPELHQRYQAGLYVFDNSNALWKIREWKKQADSLHLRHHTPAEQGALVVNL
jgi:competence protein ComEC